MPVAVPTETLAPEPTAEHPGIAHSVSASAPVVPKVSPSPPTSAQLSPSITWSQTSIRARLLILKRTRHNLAQRSEEITAAIPTTLSRTPADTLASELLPLLEAIRFLERNAARILCPRRLGRRGLPFWLAGIDAEVRRVPFGHILVIGPSNYPLFLPGVQVLQALAAGNTVTWKPGLGGAPVARIVAEALRRSGLPEGVLTLTEDTIEAAQLALAARPDKVFFTGSGNVGRHLLHQLADTATPSGVELSGNDAVIVLPSADIDRTVAALTFGMRLNGSATCMAPRRILLVEATPAQRNTFIDRLKTALSAVPPIPLPTRLQNQLQTLISTATHTGATIIGDPTAQPTKPILVLNATPDMAIAQADLFAPVLTLIEVHGTAGVLEAQAACPLALTTAIFGDEASARTLAAQLTAGTITINDLIVSTADPRVPFGGRRASGFGVTRGAEGLLEMTAVKVISARRNRSTRHYEPTGASHVALFRSIITAAHAGRLGQRWSGLKRAFTAAMEFKKK